MHTLYQLKSGELLGIKNLSLADNITSFPLEILSLANSLEVLDLSNNQLTSLPEELVQLHKLKIIFASNNDFEILPEVLGRCPNLEMVGFKANKIHTVPEQSLPMKLRWLILTDNQIEILPESLGERPELQKLVIAGNKLKQLPNTLSQSKNLQLVRVSANQLTECPAQLLDLPKLAWLAISGNPFSQVEANIETVAQIPSSHFTVQKRLGQGASGVISTATWNTTDHDFPNDIAVKVFKGEVTSDGYPEDELKSCLKAGKHRCLVQPLAQVNEEGYLALIMDLIPQDFNNLGLPPSFESCTRDTFPEGFALPIAHIEKIVNQMQDVFNHLHENKVSHGDLYAHNILFDQQANIIFGDFGAATMYHMLSDVQQVKIKQIEQRALSYLIDDLLGVCVACDRNSEPYNDLQQYAVSLR